MDLTMRSRTRANVIMARLSKLLIEQREASGKGTTEFAQWLGITYITYHSYCKGVGNPRLTTLTGIFERLGLTKRDLAELLME